MSYETIVSKIYTKKIRVVEVSWWSAHKKGKVPWTNPCDKSLEEFRRGDWLQGLVPRQDLENSKIFGQKVLFLFHLVARACPKYCSHEGIAIIWRDKSQEHVHSIQINRMAETTRWYVSRGSFEHEFFLGWNLLWLRHHTYGFYRSDVKREWEKSFCSGKTFTEPRGRHNPPKFPNYISCRICWSVLMHRCCGTVNWGNLRWISIPKLRFLWSFN